MSKLILLISLSFSAQLSGVIGANDVLLSVVAVFRHGDRTPTDFASNDKYKNLSYWPEKPGELTNVGKTQHYELGKWLRQRYIGFLPNIYTNDDIYIRSSDKDRCIMSAEANLAGLYPPVGSQIWNPRLDWMPVPIHTVPAKEDNLLKPGKSCPNIESQYKALLEGDPFKKMDKKNKDLYKFLTLNLGEKINEFTDIEKYYDTMTIEVLYNLTLPDWTQTPWGEDGHPVFPDEMKKWADLSFKTTTYTKELAKLVTGRFFDNLASHFDAVVSETKESSSANKMVLYFGHKSNICALTNVLGSFRLASYASSLLFELWHNETSQSHYVTVYYVENMKPEKLTISDCQENCDLENFFAILEPIRMNKKVWKKACSSDVATRLSNHGVGVFNIDNSFAFICIISVLNLFLNSL